MSIVFCTSKVDDGGYGFKGFDSPMEVEVDGLVEGGKEGNWEWEGMRWKVIRVCGMLCVLLVIRTHIKQVR